MGDRESQLKRDTAAYQHATAQETELKARVPLAEKHLSASRGKEAKHKETTVQAQGTAERDQMQLSGLTKLAADRDSAVQAAEREEEKITQDTAANIAAATKEKK